MIKSDKIQDIFLQIWNIAFSSLLNNERNIFFQGLMIKYFS